MKRYIRSDVSISVKDMSIDDKISLAKTSDDIEILEALAKDKNTYIKQALAKNPNITDEILTEANNLKNLSIARRESIASHTDDMELLETIARTDNSHKVLDAIIRRKAPEDIIKILFHRALNDKKLQRIDPYTGWSPALHIISTFGTWYNPWDNYSSDILNRYRHIKSVLDAKYGREVYMNDEGYYTRQNK